MLDDLDFFRTKPLFIAAGNHDAEGDLETGEIFVAYENRFLMPQIKSPEIGKAVFKNDFDLNKMYQLKYDYGNSFYAFTYGPSHNIVLNAFADFEPGSNQYNWLLEELSNNVDRNVTPWLTVTVHCPMYSTFSKHHDDPQLVNLKIYLEPLFVKFKVNFIFSGHVHAYQRTKTVQYNKVSKKGPIHIILGNGGRQANAPFLNSDAEEWVAVRDHTTYGYGTIEFFNASIARYEWVQTGHNGPEDSGNNFLDVPKNVSDVVFVTNQYYIQ